MNERLKNQVLTHRKMSSVDRLATSLKNRKYSLAEHSYYVAAMFEDFSRAEGINYTTTDFYYIMRHDYLETLSTDLIHSVKKLTSVTSECWDKIESEIVDQKKKEYVHLFSDEELKNVLNTDVYQLMKTCDLLDLFLFCLEEAFLGNITTELRQIMETLMPIFISSSFQSIKDFVTQCNREYREQLEYTTIKEIY